MTTDVTLASVRQLNKNPTGARMAHRNADSLFTGMLEMLSKSVTAA